MQTSIKWYQSKTIWFNIIMTLLSVISVLQGMEEFLEYAKLFLIITTVGNVILRVWFTSSSISPTV
jgi:hypothetical protein